ncbi:hypothetical protein DL93DRAFT_2162627, partial [Clavulina sp. PMI_390]
MGRSKSRTVSAPVEAPSQSIFGSLFGGSSQKTGLDAELDGIFKSSAGAAIQPPKVNLPPKPSNPTASESVAPSITEPQPKLKKRKESSSAVESSSDPVSKKRRTSTDDAKPTKFSQSSKGKSKAAVPDSASEDEDDSGDLEDRYLSRSLKKGDAKTSKKSTDKGDDSDEDGEDAPPLQHETATSSSSKKRDRGGKKKTKYVPEGETQEQRDARTIFVGNLPAEVAKSKSALRSLTRLITTAVPGCKIESTRFRSVAFQNPTSELPKEGDASSSTKPKPTPSSSRPSTADPAIKPSRQQGRAARWREEQDQLAEANSSSKAAGLAPQQQYLTPAEKKRVAFIKGELHESATIVHAYVVFAYEEPGRSKNVPPVMDPVEAARRAVEACDGSVFEGRTLRVDRVGGSRSSGSAKEASGTGIPGQLDPRRTVFVGGLDFQSSEEDLRTFFEKLIGAAKAEDEGESDEEADDADSESEGGDDGEEDEEDEDDAEEKPSNVADEEPAEDDGAEVDESSAGVSTWVTHVRIIRDHDTQLGKGIAYVEFKDRNCVDEVMAVERDRLKLAKRKIRVERCKTKTASSVAAAAKKQPRVTGGERAAKISSSSKPAAPPHSSSTSSPKPKPKTNAAAGPKVSASLPVGDPLLGERLKGMDKDARRAAKAADPTRQARRLAKKKARHALEGAGIAGSGQGKSAGGILGNMKKL